MRNLSTHYYLGVDLGSTTAKYVLMDSNANVLRKSYVRHQSAVVAVLIKELSALKDFYEVPLHVNFTGSAALNLATALNVPFVQEVIAASTYLKSGEEAVDVAIELGGEDGKIIFLSNGIELRMNEACAGGTGAFIDQMATLLNVSTPELNELASHAEHTYPIASRCGVFAKTDLVALLNQGISKADIAKSVFDAVCEQTISGLACGRVISGNVTFLGGPLSFLSELKQSFITKLQGPNTKFLEFNDTQYAIAYGAARAALKAEQQAQSLQDTPCLDVHHPARSRSNSSSESTAIREPYSQAHAPTRSGHEAATHDAGTSATNASTKAQASTTTEASNTTTIAALLSALQQCVNSTTSTRLPPLFAATHGANTASTSATTSTSDISTTAGSAAMVVAADAESARALYGQKESYADFVQRHAAHALPTKDLSTASGPLYLGIDLGSTTIKMVLINEENELLSSYYGHNGGEPLKNLMPKIKELVHSLPSSAYIAAICTTGYGADLARAALNAQFSEVETLSHQKAAVAFDPEVTYVIDIGGQDMKCIKVDHGVIASIQLNEACSSGCGSFLETFAAQLKLPLSDFVSQALAAQAPCDLGTRCTVFMNSKVKQAQRDNVSIGDIAAGLCLSIVRNALYKVLRIHDSSELGDHVVVQGGTFLNDAILRAFELNIGKDVIRPNIAGLMGAFGSALIAKERCSAKDQAHAMSFPDELFDLSRIKSRSFRCKGCNNHCQLTMNTFLSGQKYIHGNRCDFALNHLGQAQKDESNFFDRKFKLLFDRPILFSRAQHAQTEAQAEAKAQAKANAHKAALAAVAAKRRAAASGSAAAAATADSAATDAALQKSAAELATETERMHRLKQQNSVACQSSLEAEGADKSIPAADADSARRAKLARAAAVAAAARARKAQAAAAAEPAAPAATAEPATPAVADAAEAKKARSVSAGTGSSATIPEHQPVILPSLSSERTLVLPANVAVASRGTIGIPRVLNMFEHYPFWHALFNELRFNVLLSPVSSKEIAALGNNSIPSQSLCLPAKLAHGHITYLAEHGVDRIFMPCVPKERKYFSESDDSFACPVVGGYPEALKLNLKSLYPDLKLYTPYLLLDADKSIIRAIQEIDPSIKRKEIEHALAVAREAMAQYRYDLLELALAQIKRAQEENLPLIILSGHPYHIDPLLNHGIPALIASMGTVIVSEDAISMLTEHGPKLDVVNQWAFHSRLYRAAQYVIDHENTEMVQLVSFGCGIDAITSEQVKKILESHHKIYTMLKIDEGDTLGAAKIRLRSLLCATAEHNRTLSVGQILQELTASDASSTGADAAAAALHGSSIAHQDLPNATAVGQSVEGQLVPEPEAKSCDCGTDAGCGCGGHGHAASSSVGVGGDAGQAMSLSEAIGNDTLKERTLYMPQMAPVHFPILASCLRSMGYKIKLLSEVSGHAIEMGLKHVNNDACYPAIVAIGQLLEPVAAGQIDPKTSALLLAQTCGPCRATNYPALLNWALHDLHAEDIPIVTLQGSDLKDEKLHLKLGFKGLKRLMLSLLYGDLLQSLYLHCHTYEEVPGTALKLVEQYHQELSPEVLSKPKQFKRRVYEMVQEFSRIPLRHETRPKVGIVGEILLKYHPDANNELVENIIAEGGEPVLGDISAFVLYCLHDSIYQAKELGSSKLKASIAWLLMHSFEKKRRIIINALKHSKFEPLPLFNDLLKYGQKFVSLGQQAGEGWLLTAEMVDFIEHKIENIICVQPFACLPNHITGKGVMRAIRETYADANLCSIDYEAGSAQSNVLNRLKLFLTQAKDNLIASQQPAAAKASAAAGAAKAASGSSAERMHLHPLTHFAFMYGRAVNDELNMSAEVRDEKKIMLRKIGSDQKSS